MHRFVVVSFAVVLGWVAVARAGDAEQMWKWVDEGGTVHYTNIRGQAPAQAAPLPTHLVRDVSRIPSTTPAVEIRHESRGARDERSDVPNVFPNPAHRKLRPTFDRERLSFGCFASQVLF